MNAIVTPGRTAVVQALAEILVVAEEERRDRTLLVRRPDEGPTSVASRVGEGRK